QFKIFRVEMVAQEIITINEVEEIVGDVIEEILKPEFRRLGMNASGEWLRTVEPRSNEIWGRDYTEYLVNGRRPGKIPPIAPILNWVQAKFGISGQEAMSRAYAVAYTIAEKGTTYYQQGGTDLLAILDSQKTKDFINRRISEIANDKLEKILTNEIKTTF